MLRLEGSLWGLSTYAFLWSIWCWEEDKNHMYTTATVWRRSGEGAWLVNVCRMIPTLTLKLKIDQRVFLSPSKRKLEVNIVQSNFHIEITPR